MAHFENEKHYRVSGEELPIKVGKEVTLLLWGGDFDGSPLDVIASDENVLEITEDSAKVNKPNYRKFKVKALKDADIVQVFTRPKSASASNWDVVNFLVLEKGEKVGEHYRDHVISIARSHLGAHYLWGAAGAKPDVGGGMQSRPSSVYMLKKQVQNGDLADSVAYTNFGGISTCAGNPWKDGNHKTPPYSRDKSELDLSLEDHNHTFRTVYKSYLAQHKIGHILGENCQGKRHFDCVGFVNYCLSIALGKPVQDSISGYAQHCPDVTNKERQEGDIVIYKNYHHISLYTQGQVINATETEYGVKLSDVNIRERQDGEIIKIVRHPSLFD